MDDDELLLDDHNVSEPCVEDVNQQSIESFREWFLWSYLNVLFGSVILGLIAIGCSFRTHKFKQRKNYSKAYKWSYVTLFVNCTATLSGSVLIGYLIFTYFRNISKEEMQSMKNKLTTTHKLNEFDKATVPCTLKDYGCSSLVTDKTIVK